MTRGSALINCSRRVESMSLLMAWDSLKVSPRLGIRVLNVFLLERRCWNWVRLWVFEATALGPAQVCRDSKCKPFLNCLQIPSDLSRWVGLLGMCLCLRTKQSYLACESASDCSLRWFQQGSRKTPVRSLSFSANEAADGHVVWTVVVLSSIKFINSRWRSCCRAMC